jgi:hypothetical protein
VNGPVKPTVGGEVEGAGIADSRDAVHDLGVAASEATMMVERLLASLP